MPARKVLFLVNSLRPGGTERNVASICRHIDRRRFEPEVWVLNTGGEWESAVEAAGVKIRSLDRGWAHSPWFAIRAARAIARTDADIVHVFLSTIGFYATLARRAFGLRKPMVLSAGMSHTAGIERRLFRWFSHFYDRVIANSLSGQSMLSALGFDPARVSIIPNGHDYGPYVKPLDRDAIRRELSIGSHEKLLIFVGRLIDSKRTCDALAALAQIRACGHAAKLLVVGDGPERPALEAQAMSLGLGAEVIFAGNRSHVIDLLRCADLFIFPSETEGLPNAIIEACLASLPIVACAVPGVIDVVTDGKQAILVKPRSPEELAAAVNSCFENPSAAAKLAEAARQHALSHFGVEQSLGRLYEVYDEVLAASNNGNKRK
jgi:glycosyltransferase involved in cell wall biosynthesis